MMLSRLRSMLRVDHASTDAIETTAPLAGGSLTYARTMMDAQEQLLSHCLDTDPDRAKVQRQAITDAVADSFMELVTALAPDVVAEIGAHEASFSCKMKRRLRGAQVIAFEANPEVYERKKAQITRADVDYRNQCVSDHTGTVDIRVPISNSRTKNTMGSLLADTRARKFKSFQVDSVVADEVIGAIDNALWIDVEGAVSKVLAGGTTTLSRCQALYVEVEKTRRWAGQALDAEVASSLFEAGLVAVARDVQREWQYNIIFVRPEILEQPRLRALVTSIPMRALKAGRQLMPPSQIS